MPFSRLLFVFTFIFLKGTGFFLLSYTPPPGFVLVSCHSYNFFIMLLPLCPLFLPRLTHRSLTSAPSLIPFPTIPLPPSSHTGFCLLPHLLLTCALTLRSSSALLLHPHIAPPGVIWCPGLHFLNIILYHSALFPL